MSTATATRERPLLLSGEMVRAILDRRKTQTRRLVTLRDPSETYSTFRPDDNWPLTVDECGDWQADRCPYGTVGDRLWVRETWATVLDNPVMGSTCDLTYRATASDWSRCDGFRWRPSIHMPRWACRLILEITGIRVERLQDISEADARAEGLHVDLSGGVPAYSARQEFQRRWQSLYGKRSGYDWDSNPVVWVLAFREIA